MSVVNTEVVTPILNPEGYIVVTQNTTTGAIALVGTTVYKTQKLAKAALDSASAIVGQTTRYLILYTEVRGGILATVS
jgi:hypothetical protein